MLPSSDDDVEENTREFFLRGAVEIKVMSYNKLLILALSLGYYAYFLFSF
jgi:hypothetical protein